MNEKTNDWRFQHRWHCYRSETKSCGMSYECIISSLRLTTTVMSLNHWTHTTRLELKWTQTLHYTNTRRGVQEFAYSWWHYQTWLFTLEVSTTVAVRAFLEIYCDFDCLCFHVNIWAHPNSEVTSTKTSNRNLVRNSMYKNCIFDRIEFSVPPHQHHEFPLFE